MRRLCALALLAVAWLNVGCREARDARPQNLLLISIDTLRPDFLGSYGYERPTSPSLDALAASGVVFETALATSPWTLPSHGSLFTGLYPRRHGVTDESSGLAEEIPTLAEQLGNAGFATVGFVNSHYLSDWYGLHRGFSDHRYAVEIPKPEGPGLVGSWARDWLAEGPGEPFFLFLHFYDVHSDYRALPRYHEQFVRPYHGPLDGGTAQLIQFRRGSFDLGEHAGRFLADRYAAGIRQLDDVLGAVLAELEARGLAERTLVVVTSDHGEEFLEHGDVLHGRSQYEETLRIPLIFAGPGVPAGVRVSESASLVDVAPTVLGLLGQPLPEAIDGRDLAPLWRGAPPADWEERRFFGEADHNNAIPDAVRSIRHAELKLVSDRTKGTLRLFDLDADPGETRDASGTHPERAKALARELDAFVQQAPIAAPKPLEELPRSTVEQLRALGYLQREAAGARP